MSDWLECTIAIVASLLCWTIAIGDLSEHARDVAKGTARLQELEMEIICAEAELSHLSGGHG